MKPIPTLFEIQKAVRQNYEGNLLNWMIDKKDKVVEQQVAPLFAAIEERDAEIERLRGLMSEAYEYTAKIRTENLPLGCRLALSCITELLNIAQRNGTTKPEPAKPETFEAHGKTWTRHKAGDPMPVDEGTWVYCLTSKEGPTHKGTAKTFAWTVHNEALNWWGVIIGYRLADEAKPWTLPPPPEGKQWHRVDGWTQEMLPEGWRPLLLGETGHTGMQYLSPDGMWTDHDAFGQESSEGSPHLRTRRPLPEPQTWVDLGPEDVPPGSVFQLFDRADSSELAVGFHSVVCVSLHHVILFNEYGNRITIEWPALKDWQINRSIPLTGKWDPNAWEPCRKLFK